MSAFRFFLCAVALATTKGFVLSFQVASVHPSSPSSHARQDHLSDRATALHAFGIKGPETTLRAVVDEPTDDPPPVADDSTTIEDTTEKYGLEAGLFQSIKSDDGGESAKSLLAKYGVAYLATSIPLAALSFAICYILIDSGVDVGAILSKVGIEAGDSGEKAGTFAIAYAAHKAASPIRFPPTVMLTPVVAKLIGKEPNALEE